MKKRTLLIVFILFILITNIFSNSFQQKLSSEDNLLFRQWVHALSLSLFLSNKQATANLQNRWNTNNRDCASLIRYLVWEASSKHNEKWHVNFGNFLTNNLKDLSLNKIISFYQENRKVTYISAKNLMRYNTRFITRNSQDYKLKESDILFFKSIKDSREIYHSMLLIKNYQSGAWLVIYHTGDRKRGLRLVLLKDLFKHRQSKWHPSIQNYNFLGFFRLNFLQ